MTEPLAAADRRILRLWIAHDQRRGAHCITLDPVWLERALDALEASEAQEAQTAALLARARQHLVTYHGGACQFFDEPLPGPEYGD